MTDPSTPNNDDHGRTAPLEASLAEAIEAAATDLVRRCRDLSEEEFESCEDDLAGAEGCWWCCGDPIGLYDPRSDVQVIVRQAFELAGQLRSLTTTDPDEPVPADAAALAVYIETDATELADRCLDVIRHVSDVDGEPTGPCDELLEDYGARCQWCCDAPIRLGEPAPAVQAIAKRAGHLARQLETLTATGSAQLAERYARSN